jgi:hypothetical protein
MTLAELGLYHRCLNHSWMNDGIPADPEETVIAWRDCLTEYNHHTFRSRLEARWAVFFDGMKIDWQYEPEGFELPSGERYLPDFYLPRFKWFVEIKPTIEVGLRENKARGFVEQGHLSILFLIGAPDFRAYTGLYWYDGAVTDAPYSLDTKYYLKATEQNRLWSCPDYIPTMARVYQFSERYIRAIEDCRRERFGA